MSTHLLRARYGSPTYRDPVERHAALFIVHVDGWWEVYGPARWLERLRTKYRGTPAEHAKVGDNYP